MRWVIWSLGLIFILLALFAAGLQRVHKLTGEGLSGASVFKLYDKAPVDSPAIYGPAAPQYFALKAEGIERLKPDIAVIGSTRAFRYREEFFAPYSFYNAGGLSRNLTDFEIFLKRAPESWRPRLIIVPIESWNFKSGTSQPRRDQDFVKVAALNSKGSTLENWKTAFAVWKQDIGAPFKSFKTPDGHHTAYGELAREKGIGVRRDGSLYQSHVATTSAERHARRLTVIASKTEQNLQGKGLLHDLDQAVNPQAWDRIAAIKAEANRRGAKLIVYSPPIAPSYFPYMTDTQKYALWHYLSSDEIKQKFKDQGITYFNFSKFETRDPPIGMIDLLHPSEGLEFDMWRVMARHEDIARLLPNLNWESLDRLTQQAEAHRVLYPETLNETKR